MIYYFDDAPIYSMYNNSYFPLEGLQQVQISAGLDNYDTANGGCPPSAYLSCDSIPAHFKIDYFNYYRLNLNCGTSVTLTNNGNAANTTQLTGTSYNYVPSVYSSITIAPSGSLNMNSNDNIFYRAATITISPTGSGSFSSNGQHLSLNPTTCDH